MHLTSTFLKVWHIFKCAVNGSVSRHMPYTFKIAQSDADDFEEKPAQSQIAMDQFRSTTVRSGIATQFCTKLLLNTR